MNQIWSDWFSWWFFYFILCILFLLTMKSSKTKLVENYGKPIMLLTPMPAFLDSKSYLQCTAVESTPLTTYGRNHFSNSMGKLHFFFIHMQVWYIIFRETLLLLISSKNLAAKNFNKNSIDYLHYILLSIFGYDIEQKGLI